MSKDTLSEYGRDSAAAQVPRATDGGQQQAKELPYSPPVGPTAHMERSPGLHGDNHGNCGTQGKR